MQKMLAETFACPGPSPRTQGLPVPWSSGRDHPCRPIPSSPGSAPLAGATTDLPWGPHRGPWAHERPPCSGHGLGELLTRWPRERGDDAVVAGGVAPPGALGWERGGCRSRSVLTAASPCKGIFC